MREGLQKRQCILGAAGVHRQARGRYAETTTEAPKKEAPVLQETVTEECTEVAGEIITEPKEETVECIDEGDQKLVEYKHGSEVSRIPSRMT
jgi:hypothetical protein